MANIAKELSYKNENEAVNGANNVTIYIIFFYVIFIG